MKHLRLYLFLLIFLCTGIVSAWIYVRYFRSNEAPPLTDVVSKGSVEQLVRARGKVVTQNAYNLSFETGGTIESIMVTEGQSVQEHQSLVQLDTRSLTHDRARLVSVLAQRQAAYDKLLAGARTEEVNITIAKVKSAESALADANQTYTDVSTRALADLSALYQQAPDVLKTASVRADDAVLQRTEAFFTNDDTASPTVKAIFSGAFTDPLETGRVTSGQELLALAKDAVAATNASQTTLDDLLNKADGHLAKIQSFLDTLTSALNQTINVSEDVLATYKLDVNTGRTNVNASRADITALEQKIVVQKQMNQQSRTQAQTAINTAKSALSLAQDELSLQTAGARAQDISAARSAVSEVQDQIASIDDQIAKSTLHAPVAGVVSSLPFKVHEVVRAGEVIVSFSATGQKIESDVSELDIANIRDDGTQKVSLNIDAYPGVTLSGRVVSIDPLEIVKEGDTYYRVNILMDTQDHLTIRSGMSADVLYHVATKQNVLTIPTYFVHKVQGQEMVTVREKDTTRDVAVKTGVTDGDRIEIVSGLTVGQTIVSPSP